MSTCDNGPFDDPLFAALARHHGCHDRGADWHLTDLSPMHSEGTSDWGKAGERGFDSDAMIGVPSGMPRFRFARKDGIASLMIDGHGYVYSNHGGSRRVTIRGAMLPETLLMAAPGRSLAEYVDIPGARDEKIAEAWNSDAIGRSTIVKLTLL